MTLPQRHQRIRHIQGAKQPPGTVYVGRKRGISKFSNPHYILRRRDQEYYVFVRLEADRPQLDGPYSKMGAHVRAVELYRVDMAKWLKKDPVYFDELLNAKYISCWCDLALPCHIDPILEHLTLRIKELETL